jgi:hypothetical protein
LEGRRSALRRESENDFRSANGLAVPEAAAILEGR